MTLRNRLGMAVAIVMTALFSTALVATPANATPTIPERPDKYVANVDEAITADEQKQIENYLAGTNDAHKEKVYVYVNRSLDGSTLGEVAAELSTKWKLQSHDVVLLASTEDGAVRVHVGSESRGKIGDDKARGIAQGMLNSMTTGQTQVAIMSAATSVFYELEGVDPADAAEHDDHDHAGTDLGPDGRPVSENDGPYAGEVALYVLMGVVGLALAFGLGTTFARRKTGKSTPEPVDDKGSKESATTD